MPLSADELLAGLVAGTPPAAIDAIAKALASGAITLTSSAVGIDAIPGVGPDVARRTVSTWRSLDSDVTSNEIVLALSTANRLRRVELLNRPEIEIVWTGPTSPGTLVRSTPAVVEEMLRSVREAGEILVVGYSLTADDGTLMKGVVDLLADASRMGASVTLVLHRDIEQHNKSNLLLAWSVFARKPNVLTWLPPPDHPYTKLHAKAIVVDRIDLLVTSANFTFHGLESNLELGLRIRGPQAGIVAERFDELMAAGVLKPWA
jgi:hypothetical protein